MKMANGRLVGFLLAVLLLMVVGAVMPATARADCEGLYGVRDWYQWQLGMANDSASTAFLLRQQTIALGGPQEYIDYLAGEIAAWEHMANQWQQGIDDTEAQIKAAHCY